MMRVDIESYTMGIIGLIELQVLKLRDTYYLLWHAWPNELRGVGPIMEVDDYELCSFGSPQIGGAAIAGPGNLDVFDYQLNVCGSRLFSRIVRVFDKLVENQNQFGDLEPNLLNDTTSVRLISEGKLNITLFLRGPVAGIIVNEIDPNAVQVLLDQSDTNSLVYQDRPFTFDLQRGVVFRTGGVNIGWHGNLLHWKRYHSIQHARREFYIRLNAIRSLVRDLESGEYLGGDACPHEDVDPERNPCSTVRVTPSYTNFSDMYMDRPTETYADPPTPSPLSMDSHYFEGSISEPTIHYYNGEVCTSSQQSTE